MVDNNIILASNVSGSDNAYSRRMNDESMSLNRNSQKSLYGLITKDYINKNSSKNEWDMVNIESPKTISTNKARTANSFKRKVNVNSSLSRISGISSSQ